MLVLKYLLGLVLIFAVVWAFSRLVKTQKLKAFWSVVHVLVITLFFLEVTLNILFKYESNNWMFALKKHPNRDLFEMHPYLGVNNKAGADEISGQVRIKHNDKGLRGHQYDPEVLAIATKILTIGGSTTYGVGVNNNETWPNYLDSLIGPDSIVINTSVPGHSTVEHLVTAAIYIEEYNPDVILILAGLNDLRSSHVSYLKNDYSNFHYPHLVGSMGQCYLERVPKIATVYYGIHFLQMFNIYPRCAYHSARAHGQLKSEIDTNALRIYENNFDRLLYLCKYYTNNVIVMPQVLVEEKIKNNALSWWIPFVQSKDLIEHLTVYNKISKSVALKNNCVFLDSISSYPWTANDFVDPSHFNAEANLKQAEIIRLALEHMNTARQGSIN